MACLESPALGPNPPLTPPSHKHASRGAWQSNLQVARWSTRAIFLGGKRTITFKSLAVCGREEVVVVPFILCSTQTVEGGSTIKLTTHPKDPNRRKCTCKERTRAHPPAELVKQRRAGRCSGPRQRCVDQRLGEDEGRPRTDVDSLDQWMNSLRELLPTFRNDLGRPMRPRQATKAAHRYFGNAQPMQTSRARQTVCT
jgi:hypothetical protein